MFVLDSHCDTPSQIMRLRDLGKDNPLAQVDFPKLHAGGVDASFFALYTPASLSMEDATHQAQRLVRKAMLTFESVMDDENETGATRVQAGAKAVEYALRLQEQTDVVRELEELRKVVFPDES